MTSKKRSVADRVVSLGEMARRAREYLASGAHADWHGFQPLFRDKRKDGEPLPPHKDWVRKKFLPSVERALARAERRLEKLENDERVAVRVAPPEAVGRSSRRRQNPG
jgi:hypothetical protein